MAKGPTKKQLEAALAAAQERIAELEAEVASLRGPAPKRVGRQLAMPRGGRHTRASVRAQLMGGRG